MNVNSSGSLLNMRNFFSLICLLFTIVSISAQDGAPLLTNFKESRDIENQNWAICQDMNNVMLFANRKGILSFDGKDWISIRIPIIPYAMHSNPKDGQIFVGGENSYGYLMKDEMGAYNYVPISGKADDIGIITKIIFNDSIVWFYGDQSVSRHNLDNYKLEVRLKSNDTNPFSGMFVAPKNTFINKMNSGLYRLESDSLFPVVTGYLTEKVDILFSLPYNNNMVLLGLSNGKLSLFDGKKYYDYQIRDDGYLRDNILSEGIVVSDSLYAFSTLDGGALVIEKKSGKIRFTINNQNELPDDEIFAMGLDKSGGLWLSHQYGLTRADLNLPVENLSIYPGLKGNLTSSLRYKGELYVGTSEGVFYLTKVNNYSDVQILVKNDPGKKTSKKGKHLELQGSRRNIFTRIFGKKVAKDKNTSTGISSEIISSKTSVNGYTNNTDNRLKSIIYLYKKVELFNEKCRQLVLTPNGILAASNKGLQVINNHRAELIGGDRYINLISWQPVDGKYYIATGEGYFYVKFLNGRWVSESPDPKYKDPVYSIVKTSRNTLWLGVDNAALRADFDAVNETVKYTSVRIRNDFPQRYILDFANDSLFLFTESGIFFYDNLSKGFTQARSYSGNEGSKQKFIYPLSNALWIKHGEEWIYMNSPNSYTEREVSLLKLFNDVVSVNTENKNLWIVDGENRLFRINMNKPSKINPEINVFVKSIYNENGTSFKLSNIVFKRGDNIVNFDIVAPGYLKQNTTQYQYIINKLMTDWSQWSLRTNYNLVVTVPGEYTLKVRAKDILGNIGEPVSIKFTTKAPFTRTPIFYVLSALILLLFILLIVRFRERQLQKKNKLLEEKVKERTVEIEAQKEEITSSIEYASRIQRAMLPTDDHFKSFFSDYFIIFKPRDIVSGDFYWIGEGEKHVFLTVADCTGHGVPGAFMSTLGISTLNEIITNDCDLHANTVLNLLREKIKTSLHQTGKFGEAADGMDVAFCALNKNRKTLEFSGAYNPLFIFRGAEFKEYKADRMPVGIYYGEEKSFTNYKINVRKGDTIYIFSDGLTDQFGGPGGVKYKKASLKKLLSHIYDKPMAEQRNIIEAEFEMWKGSGDQIDDLTMIGVRI